MLIFEACMVVCRTLERLSWLVILFFLSRYRKPPDITGAPDVRGEIFEDQQEITAVAEIWARQLVSPQPKLGPVP